jgi:hypothetical protein
VLGQGKKLARAAQLLARGQLRIERPGKTQANIDEALAALGLVATEPVDVDDEFALWPECLDVFNLWCSVWTQWRTSGTGKKTGLDYAGVQARMNASRIPVEEQGELLDGVQVMEWSTLQEWASKN